MDLNIEDLNKVISTLVSNDCSDKLTEQCLKKLILYTSENDILLSHLSSILISAKNQVNCLFKSLTALHYTINRGDQKFLHYLASNNLNFVNLDKHKHKFNNVNGEYLSFLKRYLKYLQQKISVHKFINMESSWLTKLTQKNKPQTNHSSQVNQLKNDENVQQHESVLQHDIIGEQLMRKIGYIENQIDYLISEFNVNNLNLLLNRDVLEYSDLKTKSKLIELVFNLLLSDVINYANYYQDIMSELVEQFEFMNRKHCKDAIEVYRKLPEKIEILRNFLMNCNEKLMQSNDYQAIDLDELIQPDVELQAKLEHHWKILESKPKRKNSERRKEKSKYAARVRRGEESDLLNELSELVPLPDVKLQDKASVMRLGISFINTKQFVQNYFQINNSTKKAVTNKNEDLFDETDYLDVLKISNLILVLLSLDGDLVFISPNVINLIGLKQTEMLGMSIFDFVHPCDHDELKSALKQISKAAASQNSTNPKNSTDCSTKLSPVNEPFDSRSLFKENKYVSFMVRIKCTLNNKSKCVPLKSANYKMASFSGYLKESKNRPILVLSVDILLSPSAQLKCAGTSVFVTKHTPDLKFINTDEKLTSLFGYDEKDLIGSSFFQYIHASDAFQLFNSFQKLLSKGEVETGYYRFLHKTGGYFYIQTIASLLTDYSTQKPQTILCVHYLISELISSGMILSTKQSPICENALKTDENSIANKKAPKASKKNKANCNQSTKITKTNLNSKVIEKCYSPIKTNKKNWTNTTSSGDDLIVLKDCSNLKKKQITNENKKIEANQDHFAQDCIEFDCVLEKIKFKEQFKRQYEAQLNSRLAKQTIQPLFNTLSVFEPLAKEDTVYCQIEPPIDNSPLIATPESIDYASRVDMDCMPFELSNDVTYDMNYNDDLTSSPISNLSNSPSSLSCDQLFKSNSNGNQISRTINYIPEIDQLNTTTSNTNSIFFPLTDDLSSTSSVFCMIDEDEEKLTGDKKIDYENMNLIHLAPQAGDCCMSLDVGMDFEELPVNLDSETEKLIKEISSNCSTVQNTNSTIPVANSTIPLETSSIPLETSASKKDLAFVNYIPGNKPVKIPNHFNLDSEFVKKARTSLNLSADNQHLKLTRNSKINSSSVLLNLLINGEDVNNGYELNRND